MKVFLDLSKVDFDDKCFVEQRLSRFPFEIQSLIFNQYMNKATKFERNSYLRVTCDLIANKLSIPLYKLDLNLSEEDLRAQ